MKRHKKPKITTTVKMAASLAIGTAALIAQSARGDMTTYDLNTGNSAISGYSGSYGSVTVDLTSSTSATITFTSDTVGGNIYLFGDGGTVGVNVNASSWTLGTITGNNSGTGFTLGGPFSSGGSGNEDGFGSFNQTINTFDGFTHSSDTVSFTLTDTSGTWANAADVLAANSNGGVVAAHIFVTSAPANAANGALTTGFAAGGPGAVTNRVSDGGSAAIMLGFALVGLGRCRAWFARE
jgi:hypothetical protein